MMWVWSLDEQGFRDQGLEVSALKIASSLASSFDLPYYKNKKIKLPLFSRILCSWIA